MKDCIFCVVHQRPGKTNLGIFQLQHLEFQRKGDRIDCSFIAITNDIDLARGSRHCHTGDLGRNQLQHLGIVCKFKFKSIVAGLSVLVADGHRNRDNGTDFCCHVAGHLHRIACVRGIRSGRFDSEYNCPRHLHWDLPEEFIVEIGRAHGDGGLSCGQRLEAKQCQWICCVKYRLRTGQAADTNSRLSTHIQRTIDTQWHSRSGFFQLQHLRIIINGHARTFGNKVLVGFDRHLNRSACLYGGLGCSHGQSHTVLLCCPGRGPEADDHHQRKNCAQNSL